MRAFIKQHQGKLIVLMKLLILIPLCYNIYAKLTEKGFEQALQKFQTHFSWTSLWYFVPVIVLMFVNWGIEAWKWYIAGNHVEPLSFSKAYQSIFVGNALNQVLPISMGELAGRSLFHSAGYKFKAAAMTYYSQMPQKIVTMQIGVLFLSIALWNHWLTASWLHWLILIGLIDSLIWFIPFFFQQSVIPILKRIKWLDSFTVYLEAIEEFPMKDKLKIIALSALRWFVFTAQYVLLSYAFFDHIDLNYYFTLSAVNFLLQSVIPSAGIIDLGIRGNLAFIAFEPLMENQIAILSVSYLIWIINWLIPSVIGYFILLKLKVKIQPNTEKSAIH